MKFIGLSMSVMLHLSGVTALAEQLNHLDAREFRQEGQLVSLRLVSGQPLRLFVVGKEVAQFKPKELILSYRTVNSDVEKELHLGANKEYYEISEKPDGKRPFEMVIKAKNKSKEESFLFKIDKQP